MVVNFRTEAGLSLFVLNKYLLQSLVFIIGCEVKKFAIMLGSSVGCLKDVSERCLYEKLCYRVLDNECHMMLDGSPGNPKKPRFGIKICYDRQMMRGIWDRCRGLQGYCTRQSRRWPCHRWRRLVQ